MDSTRTGGCEDLPHALKAIRLNASALSDTSSLFISVSFSPFSNGRFSPLSDSVSPDSLFPSSSNSISSDGRFSPLFDTPFPPSVSPLSDNFSPLVSPLSDTPTPTNKSIPIYENIRTLMDSRSSDCFIDAKFMSNHQLATYSVTPLQLRLFNGSTNSVITQAIDLNLRFATGNITPMTFYVTSLDGSCSMVLGHNWLTHHNPLIDWVTSSITFRTSEQPSPAPPSAPPSLSDLAPQTTLRPPIFREHPTARRLPSSSSAVPHSQRLVDSKDPFPSA